ncbi:unnamed protein product, partial [Arabidopsis halleri]
MWNLWNQKPSFRFEIDNFSEKEIAMVSKVFVSGGHEWYLGVYPMDEDYPYDNYLSVYLHATNSKPLGSGWQRTANFYFLLLNQSDQVLYRSSVQEHVDFHAESLIWGIQKTLPLSLFQEEGFLENDKLIVEVYIQIVESFDGERGDVSEKMETVDINGFQVLASQVTPTRKIFAEHPDLAVDFKLKNQVVRTEYINVLLNLIETLNKPSQDHSETELSNAHSKLSELTEAGFKLEWLKSKLGKVSLKRKKPDADVQQIDERVKNEMMKLDFKLDCLKTKIEEVSLERKKSDDADGSRVKEMEGRIKNLEMMVSDLKAKLGKEKAISSDDGISTFIRREIVFVMITCRCTFEQHTFQKNSMSWGFRKALPRSKFKKKRFLENDRLIVEVYIQIVETFDGERGDVLEKKETVDINGFQVLASQGTPARKIFAEHPDLANDFKLKNQVVRTEYMSVLLNLIETLNRPSQDHSETELSNAHSMLSELTEAGFKLEWLKSKLDEVSLKRKKADADVQQLDERLKNLEQMKLDFKLDGLKSKLEEVSLERKKSDDADGSRVR